MKPDYKAIPSSIVAEGDDVWEGAGDRGDAAMYAYGAARFALARGDSKIAEELWPHILWALEYCRRQMTPDGVIASDSDELEGGFQPARPTCPHLRWLTAVCAPPPILAARSASLNRSLTIWMQGLSRWTFHRNYFGADVEGYKTYRYYDGNTELRPGSACR